MKNKSSEAVISSGSGLYTAIAFFGGYILNTVYIAAKYIGIGIARFAKKFWSVTDHFRKWVGSLLKRFGLFLLKPFIGILKYLMLSYRDAKGKNPKKGFFSSLSFMGKFLFGKKGIAVLLFNITIPIISVFFLFSVISYASSINYAVKLSVNGTFLGYIENEQVYLDAMEILDDRLNYLGGNMEIEVNPSYSIQQIGYSETLTKYQIADLILQNSGVGLDYGYGFYINDVFYGALLDFTKTKGVLDSLLANYKTDSEDEKIAFVDTIRYDEAGLYLTDSIIDEDWLIGVLTGTKQQASYYTAVENDSPFVISEKVGLTAEELDRMNPGFSDNDVHIGDMIKIGEEIPFLSISITRTEVYSITDVPYDTETVDDPYTYIGSSKEIQSGQYGENRITADVTYVNGIETGRNITQVDSVKDPVTRIISVGAKPTPEGTFITGYAPYGKLMWPLQPGSGVISQWSYWDGGYTWPSPHLGIDISSIPYQENVYASASGIVTYAGWSSGLGNYVSIYHEDLGLTTGYAHNSSIFVKKGDRVSQGQCIAAAGNTGQAQGIHVHFTVQLGNGGTHVNPREYLDIPSWVQIRLV